MQIMENGDMFQKPLHSPDSLSQIRAEKFHYNQSRAVLTAELHSFATAISIDVF